jgi:hypothetical protein
LEGPRFPEDPLLEEMHRIRNIDRFYDNVPYFRAAPWLLTPSTMKIVYALKEFWQGLGRAGGLNLGFAIIGFSLPPHDEYARQTMYRLVQNYQGIYWGEEVIGSRKEPLVFVDKRSPGAERDDILRRYAFINWDRATPCFDGFTEATLDTLFGPASEVLTVLP